MSARGALLLFAAAGAVTVLAVAVTQIVVPVATMLIEGD